MPFDAYRYFGQKSRGLSLLTPYKKGLSINIHLTESSNRRIYRALFFVFRTPSTSLRCLTLKGHQLNKSSRNDSNANNKAKREAYAVVCSLSFALL